MRRADIADLITPRDFLGMQPFSDLVGLRRDDDRWIVMSAG